MLISFAVSNHRSIKDEVVLNLDATSDLHLETTRVIGSDGNRLLRSALIYGPNGSGKSNVLKAIKTMQEIVLSSPMGGVPFASVNRRIPVEAFQLSTETLGAPSEFNVRFLLDEFCYSYGFRASSTEVTYEYLKRKGSGKEAILFERTMSDVKVGDLFLEGKDRLKFLRPNSLFLSLCAELNGDESIKVTKWFQRLTFLSDAVSEQHLQETYEMLRTPETAKLLSELARQADFGISDLQIQDFDASKVRFPEGYPQEMKEREMKRIALHNTDISTFHHQFNADGQLVGRSRLSLKHHASDGTRKFLMLVAPFLHAIRKDAILLVDEMEGRLHPLLMRQLYEWFHGASIGSAAQLVGCTHDVLLMDPDLVRRDQIWFTEKNDKGETQLVCLAEFNKDDVRPTTKFSRRYLLGVFGAIPHPKLIHSED